MDLKWKHDDIVVEDGELVVQPSLVSDIEFELLTPEGGHWFYTDYGISFIGIANTPEAAMLLVNEVVGILEKHGVEDANIKVVSSGEIIKLEIYLGNEVIVV